MIPFILGALLAATLTLPAFVRLIRQRDAAQVRGDVAAADRDRLQKRCKQQQRAFGQSRTRLLLRNRLLMEQLDKQIDESGAARDRIAQLEAEALPKAPNWGAAPAEWRVS